ncbi:MAG: isoprenylcysteine carboxylmethyltransferase family protein [Candidatus Paceibacterota bacterium]|jgi:protein-S-isoprenylcysteine O-methyltransferase Ste14
MKTFTETVNFESRRLRQNMMQEKIEYSIKVLHLKHSFLLLMTVISIYFYVTTLESSFLEIVGIVINIIGLFIWWFAKITLAENWGVGFGKPKVNQLVTHGIYSKISHPMYWGANLTFVGLIFLYPKIWFIVVSLLLIIYFFKRMGLEDKYLTEKFGKEYQDYKGKTWI